MTYKDQDPKQDKQLQELRNFFAGTPTIQSQKTTIDAPQKDNNMLVTTKERNETPTNIDPGEIARQKFHEQQGKTVMKLIKQYGWKIEEEIAAVDNVGQCTYWGSGHLQMPLYLRKNCTVEEARNKLMTIFPELAAFVDLIAFIEWSVAYAA
jgi:hypothetical protein